VLTSAQLLAQDLAPNSACTFHHGSKR